MEHQASVLVSKSELIQMILGKRPKDPGWWLSRLEHHPIHHKAEGSIPSRSERISRFQV